MTPAAELAFRRAATLARNHPAPKFFYGLALAQGGRLDEAEALWRGLLADAPAGARWRSQVEQQIMLVERARAIAAMQAGQAPPSRR
jgi:cytochrome c-type biogenesis protein CcmH/NrfG